MSSDPTELAGIAEASTEMVEAWSLDEDMPDEPRISPQIITVCGVAASLVAVAAAVWVGYDKIPTLGMVKVIERTTISQVAAPPPPVAQPKQDLDADFLTSLRSAGWHIEEPANMVTYAHWYCEALVEGIDPRRMQLTLQENGSLTPEGASQFGEMVKRTYGCHGT
jgi:hypothetical protein